MNSNSARRMADIAPFHVMKLLARARQLEAEGRPIVHMEIGEPDFATPQPIIQAGINALQKGYTHYTPALGLPELRIAIADFYQSHFGSQIDSKSIIVTPGSSGALQLVCGVLINPGDEVLLTDPGYPCNRHFVQLMGGVPKFISLTDANNFSVTLEELKQNWTDNTRAIILATPSNPTGNVYNEKDLTLICEFVKSKNAYVILDEIYNGLVYEEQQSSFAGQFDNVFIINSFSKYFCMTGWRIGWLVSPESFIDDIDKLAQNIFLAASTPGQYAALSAFKEESLRVLEDYRKEFQHRRDYLFDAIQSLGFRIKSKPQGAFYLYADSSRLSSDSFKLAESLLEHANVAITPGKDFGHNLAESHVRFAYTTSITKLEQGIAQLRAFFDQAD